MDMAEETNKPVPDEEVGNNGVPSDQGNTGNEDTAGTDASNTNVGESDKSTEHPNINVEHGPGVVPKPSRAFTTAARVHAQTIRDNEVGRHEQLAHVILTSVEEHKAGTIRLTKNQLSKWRDLLFQMHTTVINAHRDYVENCPGPTEEEQIRNDAWEANFETEHGSIFSFTDKYSRSRSDASSIRSESAVSVSTQYSSTRSKKGLQETLEDFKKEIQISNVKTFADLAASLKVEMRNDFKTEMQRSSAEALEAIKKANNDLLESFLTRSSDNTSSQISAAWKTAEEKIEVSGVKTRQELGKQVTQQLEETKKEITKDVTQQISQINIEVAARICRTDELIAQAAKDSAKELESLQVTLKSLEEAVDKKTASSESNLNDKIYRFDEAQRDVTDALQDAINRLNAEKKAVSGKGTNGVGIATSDHKPATSCLTSTPAARPKSVEETILQRRTLMSGKGGATSDSSATYSFNPNLTHTVVGGDGSTARNLEEGDPSYENANGVPREEDRRQVVSCCGRQRTPVFTIKPFDGDPKNYARFKAKFKVLYHNEFDDDAARPCMLEELLDEKVRNEIGECLTDSSMYNVVWDRLDAVYARPEVMDQSYLNTLLELPTLKSTDAASLKTFANRLHGAVVTLNQSQYVDVLNSRVTMMVLEAKLPSSLKEKWNLKKKKNPNATSNVLDFDDWITSKALTKDDTKNVFATLSEAASKDPKSDGKKSNTPKNPPHISTINHVSTSSSTPPKVAPTPAKSAPEDSRVKEPTTKKGEGPCFICKGEKHRLAKCPVFVNLSPTQRAEKIFYEGRCLSCMGSGHLRTECKTEVKCYVVGCVKQNHCTLLHGSEFIPPKKTTSAPTPSAPPMTYLGIATITELPRRRVSFKIVPVRIQAGGHQYDTFAFLDCGSDTTLVRSDVAMGKLRLSGPLERINVKSYDGVITNVDALKVKFTISSIDGKHVSAVERAYAIEKLRAALNPPVTEEQRQSWPYLQGITTPYVKPEDVTVLIGMDIAPAHDHKTSISPPVGVIGPMAFETPFGWCLGGKNGPAG